MRRISHLPFLIGSFLLAGPSSAGPEFVPALVARAKEIASQEKPQPIYRTGGKKKILVGKESVRVTLTPSGEFRVVRLNLSKKQSVIFAGGKRRKTSVYYELYSVSTPGCAAEKIGGGGPNANYRIVCDGNEEPVLAGAELLMGDGGPSGTAVYVPYSDPLAVDEVVSMGDAYIRMQVRAASESLRRKKVLSAAFPEQLVADIFQEEMLFRLALIEHIDHSEFRDCGPRYVMRKVLTQLGLNGPDTFRYSRSRTGALCLMQIQPSTYREIYRAYKGARLPPSAEAGSCSDHALAVEVAYLVLDSKLAKMPVPFRGKFIADRERYGLYLAAAYNGGESRATRLYFAEEKQPGFLHALQNIFDHLAVRAERKRLGLVLREETWIFLKKYFELSNIPDANGN
jgi:hypothetical protein